jgi:hypothetical protein
MLQTPSITSPHAALQVRLSVVAMDPKEAPTPVIASVHCEVEHTIVLCLSV